MSEFDGRWDVTIATPIGRQEVVFAIVSQDGAVRGVARGKHETVPFIDPVIGDGHLLWSQRVTKPLRLNLAFDVTVQGDEMTGTARAGRLPASKVWGTRIP